VLVERCRDGHRCSSHLLSTRFFNSFLRVTGDSIIGAGIFPGDYVIVRKQDTAVPGNIVIALIRDEATVKFLRQHGHEFILEAANPAYASIALTDETPPQCILGRMVGLYCHLGESLAG